MEFCRRWDREEIAKQYQLVLLLRLRDHGMSKAENLGDLLYYPDADIHRDVTKELVSTLGANTLIILDGYDELPGACRSESSVFLKLIYGQLLPLATILITSRPWAAQDLHKNCRHRIFQHIEILGFGGKEIDEYVTSVFTDKGKSTDDRTCEEVMSYLRTYPQIRACMYIPVNAAIVVSVYMDSKAGNCILPQTLTQLYYALVQTLLLRYLYGHTEYGQKRWNISSLKDLPQEVYSQLMILSQLAYTGICTDQEDSVCLVYTNLPPDFETLGLMQSVPQLYVTRGESVSHNFLHLTVQEFLAALHISNMSPEQQLDHLHRQKEERMRVVLRFLAGLTKLDSIPPEVLRSLLLDELGDSLNVFRSTLMADVRISVEHVNWMFETQSGDIFPLVFQEKTVQFGEDVLGLLLLDYYSLGYCFAHSHSKWMLHIHCDIEEEEIKMLVSGTKTARNTGGKIVVLEGTDNHKPQLISAEALKVLFNGLENMINLQELHLPLPVECCCIAWPNLSGLQVLTLRLWGNRNWELDSLLPSLSLHSLTVYTTRNIKGAGHGLELEDCRAIGNLLSSSKCLRCFELDTLVVHNEGVEAIIVGMSVNESLPLTELVMNGVGTFSDTVANSLAMFITKSTTLLHVSIVHCTFSAHGLLKLAQAIHYNTSIQERELVELNCTVDGDDNAKDFFQLLAGHPQWKEWIEEEPKFTHISENGVETVVGFLHEDNVLRDLNLSDNSIKDDGVTALSLALQHNSNLQYLSLNDNSISNSGAAALANALHHNSTLDSLDLSNNFISDSGTAALANALCHRPTFRSLNLSNNCISDSGAAALANALCHRPTFWFLNLSNNCISDSGAAALANALHHNSILGSLNLSNNFISDSGAAALAHALHHNSTLGGLDLSNNSISNSGAADLAHALHHNSQLSCLNLTNNSASDIGATSLAQALLHNSRLYTLNLSSNNISDSGAANLGQVLHHNSTLMKLKLSNNRISCSGAAYIARALRHNSKLRTLKLSNNNVGDSGADALAQALHRNSVLEKLDLSNNSISKSARAFLHHLESDSRLGDLNLSNNSLNDDGVAAIAQGILVKDKLRLLNLSNNGISDHGATALAQALHHIRSLDRLDLRDNDDIGEEGTHQIIQALSVSEAVNPVCVNSGWKPDRCGLILPRKCEQYATQCPQYSDVKNRIGFQ